MIAGAAPTAKAVALVLLPAFVLMLAGIRIYPDAAHGFLFQYPTEVAADVNAFLAIEEGGGAS
jgi:hypothetical protein